MFLENRRPILLVLVSRPGQLVCVQTFSGVVSRSPEQNGVTVDH
jgi:hypothetical protein